MTLRNKEDKGGNRRSRVKQLKRELKKERNNGEIIMGKL